MASTLESTVPLSPVLSDRYALKWHHSAFCFLFLLIFLLLSHTPLKVEGPWRYLRLGVAGWDTYAVGVDDPVFPLNMGMKQPQLAWMTSWALARLYALTGAEGVSQFCAVIMFLSYLTWARCFFVITQSKLVTGVALAALFLATNWQFGGGHPGTFGFLFAAVLSWILLSVIDRTTPCRWAVIHDMGSHASRRELDESNAESGSTYVWWAVPLLMVTWCNFSGTFLVGIVMLAAAVVDIGIQAARIDGAGLGFWRNRRFQHAVYLFQLSVLATCLHPLGMGLWSAVIDPFRNPFWIEAGGGAEISLVSMPGLQLLVAVGLIGWILRNSLLRICVADLFLTGVLLLFAVLNVRLFGWLAPGILMFIVPHFSERTLRLAAERRRTDTISSRPHSTDEVEYRPLKFAHSLFCVLLIWIGFAFSPFSQPLLGGPLRPADRLYSRDVPWGVAKFLTDQPPSGLVWTPSYWSDWIAWRTSPESKLFAPVNLALLPAQVKRDYERIYLGDDSWEGTLNRYAVSTLVVDKTEQDRLFNVVLRDGKNWRIVFESERAIILRRKGQGQKERGAE